jgi:excisionase family DNA binding protein
MSTGQAAAELGVSPRTIRRLVLAGEIPAFTVGAGSIRHYRITPHALKSYREHHQTTRRIGGAR